MMNELWLRTMLHFNCVACIWTKIMDQSVILSHPSSSEGIKKLDTESLSSGHLQEFFYLGQVASLRRSSVCRQNSEWEDIMKTLPDTTC